nr:glycosyltransferase 87 family protein [Corynebacterium kutscheri]
MGVTEPLARDFIEFLGGKMGRFARIGTQPFWTPLRCLILLSLTFLSLGFLAKANCVQSNLVDGIAQLDWSGNRQYTSACYNDIVPLYGGRGLDALSFPYAHSWQEDGLTRYMEYPVLTGIFQWLMAVLATLFIPVAQVLPWAISDVAVYYAVTCFVMSCMWVWVVRAVSELMGNRVWDAVLVAASPLVVIHAFTNWDIVSIAAATAGLLMFARSKPLAAGVWIGIGIALKLWPLFLCGAFLVLAIRAKNYAPVLKMYAAAAFTWLLVNAPIMALYPTAWREFSRLNAERGWEWTTIYALSSREFGWTGFDGSGKPVILNTVTLLAFLILCLAILLLGISIKRRPRVAELCYLIVAAFLLVNKVWSPQYSIWLVVLAALALPEWKLIFSWGLIDALTWPVLMWHMLGTDNKGVPGQFLDLFIIGRDAMIITIAVLIIRQMLGKRPDKVRDAHGGKDPLSGVYGEEDQFVLALGKQRSPSRRIAKTPVDTVEPEVAQ